MKSLSVAAFTVGVGVPAGVAIAADLPLSVATPVAVEASASSTLSINSSGFFLDASPGVDGFCMRHGRIDHAF
ncbi:hypothetical protein Snov_1381 [Ancylobacter novellus DSM 506]|uniref:Uncharacterized protein n=1 Tax=Ancylobacter novellus (strain ATCC 8093 / DSM 506 / JCM 20403 / CCM 1077 / IAM 12100 / NBRC 12443 / NCIMB 10456) TaxID=639283 RepID=D7A8Y6_ANCN5|nr:hypothetical protein [Ancylobacter novellus]ADH88691.1 hypothetical protein Snov_1381 [Ancylobacter novellus DSM 506]